MLADALPDFFSLFELPQRYRIEPDTLQSRHHAVQRRVHPDRYAQASATEKRVASQWASHANEAFRVLQDPLERARYLCQLNGYPVEVETGTGMSTDFLMRQMSWRESWDDLRARLDPEQPNQVAGSKASNELQSLKDELIAEEAKFQKQMTQLLDEQNDFAKAASMLREWWFVRKFHDQVRKA